MGIYRTDFDFLASFKTVYNSDDRISCLETFNFWTLFTVTYLNKIKKKCLRERIAFHPPAK